MKMINFDWIGNICFIANKDLKYQKFQQFNRTSKVSSKHNLARLRSQRYD